MTFAADILEHLFAIPAGDEAADHKTELLRLLGEIDSEQYGAFISILKDITTNDKSESFEEIVNAVAWAVHETAKLKGWWDTERNVGEMIALMHSELSEALEGYRDGNPESKKIPGFTSAEEEFADCIIRIFDTCAASNFNIGAAIEAKIAFNTNRPYKHGGKEF